jgi:hypothetical protein
MLVVRVTENVRAVQSSYYSSCPCTALFIPEMQNCYFFTSTYSRYSETMIVLGILAVFPTHSRDKKNSLYTSSLCRNWSLNYSVLVLDLRCVLCLSHCWRLEFEEIKLTNWLWRLCQLMSKINHVFDTSGRSSSTELSKDTENFYCYLLRKIWTDTDDCSTAWVKIHGQLDVVRLSQR